MLDGCKRKRCAWSCLNNLSIWNWGTQYAHQNVGIVILWNFDAALFFHTSAILTQIYSSYLCSVQGAPSNRKVSPTRRQKTFTNEYQQSSIKFQLAWTNNLVCLNKSRFRWKKIISKEALIWSVYIYSNSLPLVALTIISFFNLQASRSDRPYTMGCFYSCLVPSGCPLYLCTELTDSRAGKLGGAI